MAKQLLTAETLPIFLLIRCSLDPTLCGNSVYGPLQFMLITIIIIIIVIIIVIVMVTFISKVIEGHPRLSRLQKYWKLTRGWMAWSDLNVRKRDTRSVVQE